MRTIEDTARLTRLAYKAFLDKGTTRLKNDVLATIANRLREQRDQIINENEKDLENGRKKGLTKAFIDRLSLNGSRIDGMINACIEIEALKDPVGSIHDQVVRPDGFTVGKMNVPIGVIGMIYEARPNVTIEAATLCLKTGNGVVLRGGADAFYSNMALVGVVRDALKEHGVDENLVSFVETTDRAAVIDLIQQNKFIDLIIPRGGEGLIRLVTDISKIPVLKHYKGVCHTYVNEFADLDIATKVTVNAKVQRPAVCNSTETLLVDEAVASKFLPVVTKKLRDNGVEIRGCEKTRAIVDDVIPATEDDWYAEYLDLILAIKVVSNMDEAIAHIDKYGSAHTDAIITRDIAASNKFIRNVDSSSVIVNATTRLADGGVYGLGAEIGIATDRLHARGPMGLEELTTYKWVVNGNGNIRS